jgi:hypothetical protein
VLIREFSVAHARAPILWCDNIGATYLTAYPIFHRHMEHIKIDYHFVRERVALDVHIPPKIK